MDNAQLANLASWMLLNATDTENWDHVRDVVSRLFASGGFDVRWTERRLEATRNRVITEGPPRAFSDRLAEVERWRIRFADLLDDHPEVADDLRALVDELRPRDHGRAASPAGRYYYDDNDTDGGIPALSRGGDAERPVAGDQVVRRSTYEVGFSSIGSLAGDVFPRELYIDDPVSRAIRALRPGLLAFNPPAEMTQGRKERVEVAIAGSAELRDSLIAGLEGRGQVQIEDIERTSRFMGVELRGDAFEITPLSSAEQVVDPTARWQFDVRPLRAGLHTLALSASLQFGIPEVPSGTRIAVPVFEREIRIRISISYGTRNFLGSNWQWLVGTGIGAGGTAAAFLTIFH